MRVNQIVEFGQMEVPVVKAIWFPMPEPPGSGVGGGETTGLAGWVCRMGSRFPYLRALQVLLGAHLVENLKAARMR